MKRHHSIWLLFLALLLGLAACGQQKTEAQPSERYYQIQAHHEQMEEKIRQMVLESETGELTDEQWQQIIEESEEFYKSLDDEDDGEFFSKMDYIDQLKEQVAHQAFADQEQ